MECPKDLLINAEISDGIEINDLDYVFARK